MRATMMAVGILVMFGAPEWLHSEAIPLRNWKVARAERPIASASHQQDSGSVFFDVDPCRLVDTRNADGAYGGPMLTGGVARAFTIPTGPCPGIPIAAAYSLNIAVTGSSAGAIHFLTAYPAGTTRPTVASMNFDGGETTSNAALVPASSDGSIEVYSSTNVHVIIDINGYFKASAGGGHIVAVAPGANPSLSGTALLNALGQITDNSSSNPYVIKLAPGVYDIGSSSLSMKPFVDIEGSGTGVTRISGSTFLAAENGTVRGATDAELRWLTVENISGTGGLSYAVAIYNDGVGGRIIDVVARASGASFSYAIHNNNGAAPVLTRVTAVSNYVNASQNNAVFNNNSSPLLVDCTLVANGTSAAANRAMFNAGSSSPLIIDGRFSAGAGGAGSNPAMLNTGNGTIQIHRSIIQGSSPATVAINNSGTPILRIAGTQIIGTVTGSQNTCVHSYNSLFAPLATNCN